MDRTTERWFRDAVSGHEARLVGYASFLLGGDVARAKDVVQECFWRLWQAGETKVGDHLEAWLFTVCRHRAFELGRKDRRLAFLGDELPEAVDEQEGECSLIEEEHERLHHCMGQLHPRRQELVRLKFFQGLSYQRMAEVCGLSVSNVGVQLHHALQCLRNCFHTTKEN